MCAISKTAIGEKGLGPSLRSETWFSSTFEVSVLSLMCSMEPSPWSGTRLKSMCRAGYWSPIQAATNQYYDRAEFRISHSIKLRYQEYKSPKITCARMKLA